MIQDKIQNDTVMNGVSYFPHYSSPYPCEITYSIKPSARSDAILREKKRGCPVMISARYPLYIVQLQENGDLEIIYGLSYQNAPRTDSNWTAQSVKHR